MRVCHWIKLKAIKINCWGPLYCTLYLMVSLSHVHSINLIGSCLWFSSYYSQFSFCQQFEAADVLCITRRIKCRFNTFFSLTVCIGVIAIRRLQRMQKTKICALLIILSVRAAGVFDIFFFYYFYSGFRIRLINSTRFIQYERMRLG